MFRPDINRAPTVLALIATTMTSVVCGLFSFAVLLSDDMEPACDPGYPGRDASGCAIGADDYRAAFPFALAAVTALVITAVLFWSATEHRRASGGHGDVNRAAWRQARIVVIIAAVSALGGVVSAVAVNSF